MSQEKEPLKQDIVSSIFNRSVKKRLSSLFVHKGAKTAPAGAATLPSGTTIIKKKFPFGVDIGTNSIKIAQLGFDREGGIKLIDLCVQELPEEARNPKERGQILAQSLKKMADEKGLKGDCFAIMPHLSVKVNLIRLPQMPEAEIDKALRWEIRQTIQADIDEVSLDYIILEGKKIKFLGNQTGILAVTTPKKDIFEHLALLESAGLNPLAIDIEPLADLAVLDYIGKASASEVVLFLDFGAGKTSLSVICNNELVFIRYLNVTGNSLTKAISEYCGIPWQEAEETKKIFGLSASSTDEPRPSTQERGETAGGSSDKAIKVRNAILPLLENMVQDIEHTFKYFSYQVTQSQITQFDRVILSGGSAYLKSLLPYLRNRLNKEVELITPLSSFGSLVQPVAGDDLGLRLNVALGEALRGRD